MPIYKVRVFYKEPQVTEYTVTAPNELEALSNARRGFEMEHMGCYLENMRSELVEETTKAPEDKPRGRKAKK